MLISQKILQQDANDHVFVVIECPDRPTVSIDMINHHGRRGIGIRIDGMGTFHAMVDVATLGPAGGERLFRFCSMCGGKLQLASSRDHQCREEE